MRLRGLVCLLFAWGCLIATAAADLPGRLTFFNAPGFSLTIESPVYAPANQDPNGPLSGKGTYTITVGGSPAFTGSNFPFDGILADASGQVKTNQVGYAIKSDINWRNALGTGTDLTIPAGSKIIVSTTGGAITGSATVVLPYRSDLGARATGTLPNFSLSISTSGAILLDTGLVLANGPKLKLGGFAVGIGSSQTGAVNAHLTIAKPPTAASKNHLLLIGVPIATLDTPLPGLSATSGGLATSAPLQLSATNVTIDETGTPSADKIGIGEAPLQASTDPVVLASPAVDLLQPMNFGLRPTAIQASLTNGIVQLSSLTFDLVLPTTLSDGNGSPVVIPGLVLNSSGQVTVPKFAQPIKATWQTNDAFGKIDLLISGFGFSTTKGLTDVSGSVQFDPAGPISGAPTFKLQDFSVDANGASGTVSLAAPGGAKIWGIPVSLNEGSISFDEGNVVGADISATETDFHFGLRIGASAGGAVSIAVESGDVNPSGWGPIKLHITGGSGTIDNTGLGSLLISGQMTVPHFGPVTDDITLDFKDLGFQHGQVVASSFKIAKPVNVDTGPVSLNLTELVFQTSPVQFTLTGDVKFPDIFGGSGQASFKGLEIDTQPFGIKIKGIGLGASIPGMGKFGATFEPGAKDFNGFKNPFIGKATVQITGLPGFDTDILISPNAWLLGLNVSIPPVPIPIPPTTPPFLYVLGANGALGYGIGVLPGNNNTVPESSEMPFRNYQSVPGNFFIQAGLDVGTVDQFLLWGNLTFSGGFPAVQIDLRGDMYVLQSRATSKDNPDTSRKAYLEMIYKAPDSFFAHGNVDITLLKDLPIYHLTGTLDAEFSPQAGYIHAGYPVDPNGYGFDFLGIGAKSGFGLDFWPQHSVEFGMLQYADLWGFVKLKRGFDIGATLTTGSNPSLVASADFYAEGDIDFSIVSAYARAEAKLTLGLPMGPVNAKARFEAGVHTFMGTMTVDTGEVDLLGK